MTFSIQCLTWAKHVPYITSLILTAIPGGNYYNPIFWGGCDEDIQKILGSKIITQGPIVDAIGCMLLLFQLWEKILSWFSSVPLKYRWFPFHTTTIPCEKGVIRIAVFRIWGPKWFHSLVKPALVLPSCGLDFAGTDFLWGQAELLL